MGRGPTTFFREKTIILVHFQRIAHEDKGEAYEWHRLVAEADEHLFPRTQDAFDILISQRSIWFARDDLNDIIGMAYYAPDGEDWEVGGLMIADEFRSKGIGSILMRLALGTVLTELDPLASNQRVVAHVHRDNPLPRSLIEKALKFGFSKSVKIPADALPGLKADDDGFIHGDEFLLTVPDSLIALAVWCEQWGGVLKDGDNATITLPRNQSLNEWATDLREMVHAHK